MNSASNSASIFNSASIDFVAKPTTELYSMNLIILIVTIENSAMTAKCQFFTVKTIPVKSSPNLLRFLPVLYLKLTIISSSF